MKTKKLLSLLLALMMMLSVVPMYASAADPITLTTSNIVTYPTAEYINNGAIYFGQKVGDAISFSGGEVQYNGETVPGHFEPVDMNTVPTSTGTQRADIKFIPDDTTLYSGFEYKRCRYVTYTVSKTTPVFVDAENDPLVASEVEAGAKLSTSILSGGKMVNPYNADEAKIAARSWEWSNPDTVINESGYYEAMFVPVGYEKTTAQVYVKIAGEIPETEIAEMPTIADFVYNSNLTWKDVKIEGGKAVLKGTETEIEGSFIVADNVKDWIPGAGPNSVPVVFTPNDPEAALPYSINIPVKVNPCPISFGEDHKGTSIDDPFVYEVAPGTTVGGAFPKGYLNYPTPSVVEIEDANSYVENGKVYKVTVLNYTNTNYTGSEAYVKFVFKDVEFAVSSVSYYAGTEKINVKFSESNFSGTFDVYVDDILVGDDIPRAGDHIDVPYAPETSGTHTVKVVYNPTENDYYFMADYETEIQANVERHITLKNMDIAQKVSVNGKEDYPSNAYILYGDEISIKYGFEDLFVSWVITDTAGKAVDLGVDLTSSEITFTMPDHDLVIAVKKTLDEEAPDDGTDGGFDIDDIFGNLGDLTEGDSDNSIENIFNNIIAFFKNIITTITNLFRSIGDAS